MPQVHQHGHDVRGAQARAEKPTLDTQQVQLKRSLRGVDFESQATMLAPPPRDSRDNDNQVVMRKDDPNAKTAPPPAPASASDHVSDIAGIVAQIPSLMGGDVTTFTDVVEAFADALGPLSQTTLDAASLTTLANEVAVVATPMGAAMTRLRDDIVARTNASSVVKKDRTKLQLPTLTSAQAFAAAAGALSKVAMALGASAGRSHRPRARGPGHGPVGVDPHDRAAGAGRGAVDLSGALGRGRARSLGHG